MRALRIAAVLQVVFVILLAGLAFGQSPAEKIVIISKQAAVQSGGRTIDTVEQGTIFYAGETSGAWVRIDSMGGWVLKSSVIPLDQAVEYFTKAIERDPDNGWLYASRGFVWGASYDDEYSGLGETEKAIADLTKAIKLRPGIAPYHFCRAMNYEFQNEWGKAIDDYTEVIRLDPERDVAFNNRAGCWNELGDFDKALADVNAGLKVNRNSSLLWNTAGFSRAQMGEYEKAISNFSEGLRLAPESDFGLAHLARIYATCPDPNLRDGPKAVELATKACELSQWKNPWYLDSLAAAYARIDDFDQAIQWEEKAIELAPNYGPYQERLTLYNTGTAFEEAPVVR